jgi:hypothetical protein
MVAANTSYRLSPLLFRALFDEIALLHQLGAVPGYR